MDCSNFSSSSVNVRLRGPTELGSAIFAFVGSPVSSFSCMGVSPADAFVVATFEITCFNEFKAKTPNSAVCTFMTPYALTSQSEPFSRIRISPGLLQQPREHLLSTSLHRLYIFQFHLLSFKNFCAPERSAFSCIARMDETNFSLLSLPCRAYFPWLRLVKRGSGWLAGALLALS
jgi:hypothetical protein